MELRIAKDRLMHNFLAHRGALPFIVLVITITSLYVFSGAPQARVLEVGPGKRFALPSEAAAIAKDRDHVKIAAGTYMDCAVWRADHLIIEGTASEVIISEKTCMGMGLFVILGNDV